MIVNMDFSKNHSTEYAVMELTDRFFIDIDEKIFRLLYL